MNQYLKIILSASLLVLTASVFAGNSLACCKFTNTSNQPISWSFYFQEEGGSASLSPGESSRMFCSEGDSMVCNNMKTGQSISSADCSKYITITQDGSANHQALCSS